MMEKKTIMGKVTFIHHDKNYVTIEYNLNSKTKTINGNISKEEQLKLVKKEHQFRIGDEVSFIIMPSAKGDKMIASRIQYHYNNALDNLLQKAITENRFVGYLKKVDDTYFVKETGSYILFPLILSPWELKPHEDKLNEPVFFILENLDKPGKVTASLFKHVFIPEYATAMQLFKNKTIIEAPIYKITPHGIFINIVGNRIQAKISQNEKNNDLKIGDSLKVKIVYLGNARIVAEKI